MQDCAVKMNSCAMRKTVSLCISMTFEEFQFGSNSFRFIFAEAMTNEVEQNCINFDNLLNFADAGAEKGLYLDILSTYKDEGTDVHTLESKYLLI